MQDSSDQVLEQTPQDVEQLLIYALLSSREGHVHHLVYFNVASGENPFRAYSVRILRKGPVAQYFRARIAALDHAQKTDDPTQLGRCRYASTGCAYLAADRCGCASRDPIDAHEMSANIRLTRDPEFEVRLCQLRDSTQFRRSSGIRLWDLFTPRRAFARRAGEEVFRPDENYTRRRRQEETFLTSDTSGGTFDVSLPEGEEEGAPLVGRGIGFKLMESTGAGSRELIIPALIRVSNGRPPEDPRRLPEAYKGQLGAYCAIKGSARGITVVTYPKFGDVIQAYQVRFDNISEIRMRLARRLAVLQSALRAQDPAALSKCPSWLQNRCDPGCLCVDSGAVRKTTD